ncbi:polysaccharide deacetylase family protein [bacterium]|nr:polysaccharide deacetylase family protein [bacterium]
MRQLLKRLQTRSFGRVFRRLYTIAKRYGFTASRYREALKTFVDDAASLRITPTFPVTADLLSKHGSIIKEIQDLGAEFAIHGYRHIDYSLTDAATFGRHLEKAGELFAAHGVAHAGFRFPYLKMSDEHLRLLSENGFSWDSSTVISWDVVDEQAFTAVQRENYRRILDTYSASAHETAISVPAIRHGMVEIPVAVPDDDMIVERLECSDEETIYRYWNAMFSSVLEHQESLVLQLHPERFFIFREPLFRLLDEAAANSDVWLASLGEIADWWRLRHQFRPQFSRTGNGELEVRYPLDGRITVCWMHADETRFSFEHREANGDCVCRIPGDVLPIVGLAGGAESDATLVGCLDAEGYVYETADRESEYAVMIEKRSTYDTADVEERLARARRPLMKLGRWPSGCRAALAVTGDIDCIDVFDFFNRIAG